MRVTYRKARKTKTKGGLGARYLVKCGCRYDGWHGCSDKLEIYPPPDVHDPNDEYWGLNGVLAKKQEWLDLFTKIDLLP